MLLFFGKLCSHNIASLSSCFSLWLICQKYKYFKRECKFGKLKVLTLGTIWCGLSPALAPLDVYTAVVLQQEVHFLSPVQNELEKRSRWGQKLWLLQLRLLCATTVVLQWRNWSWAQLHQTGPRLCLVAKSVCEKHYSIFRLYAINIVLSQANQAQKIRLATYIKTIQLIFLFNYIQHSMHV